MKNKKSFWDEMFQCDCEKGGDKMEKENDRIVVCCNCGTLYDLHYIDNVKTRKKSIYKFECKHCGMVDVCYKNLKHFGGKK